MEGVTTGGTNLSGMRVVGVPWRAFLGCLFPGGKPFFGESLEHKVLDSFGKRYGPLCFFDGWEEFGAGIASGDGVGREKGDVGFKEGAEGVVNLHATVDEFSDVVSARDLARGEHKVCLEVFLCALLAVETDGISGRVLSHEFVFSDFEVTLCLENPLFRAFRWVHRGMLSLTA